MGGEDHGLHFSSLIIIHFLLVLVCFQVLSPAYAAQSWTKHVFSPPDNYLIDCGSPHKTTLDDGRTFKSDSESVSVLSTNEDVQISIDAITVNNNQSSNYPATIVPLCRTARIFPQESVYTFFISQKGKHWIRLYFSPLPHPLYDLKNSVFTVLVDQTVLLRDFSVKNYTDSVVFKEYIVNASTDRISIKFQPQKGSSAFINALEVVSAPDELIPESVPSVTQPGANFSDLSSRALEVMYRLNVGGPVVTPKNDTLSRTWIPDGAYNTFPQGAQVATAGSDGIKYPKDGTNPNIAPHWVYETAAQMQDAQTMDPNFNLTWQMSVDPSFEYMIRLHFCDIVSKNKNELYFNVYVNSLAAITSLDLSTRAGDLATAYYADFVINTTTITNSSIMVQVGPVPNSPSGMTNAILNGLEIIKLSNIANSLDGLITANGEKLAGGSSITMKIVSGIGLALALTAMIFLGMMFVRWKKRPTDWEKKNSFSAWLLPLQSSHTSFLSSKSSSSRRSRSSVFSSRKTKSGYSRYFSNQGLGRFFTFSELQAATRNFDEKAVIGVGGFGKVFLGELDDGEKVAIKRGNPGSEQGINEFQTEIQMLSKLRHRHLVSLIGFCDEQSEMILVYEYMSNGPFRDHLYGSNKPCLTWKQRLEISIGAARGLHYLHTGAAQGIIHRDVKTTNILLDENFVAKVADFGLSKAAAMDQGHVSTAVKGSFGYLDPEYFRRQQLTEKSDVYSFGVVLLEVLCSRPVISPGLSREQVSLAEWALQNHRKGTLEMIIDPRIAETIAAGSLKKFVEAAEKCLEEYGVDRPSMGDVLWNLEYALQLQEASAQIDFPPDKSTNLIDFEHSTAAAATAGAGQQRSSDEEEESPVLLHSADDSQVTDFSSPMISLGPNVGR